MAPLIWTNAFALLAWLQRARLFHLGEGTRVPVDWRCHPVRMCMGETGGVNDLSPSDLAIVLRAWRDRLSPEAAGMPPGAGRRAPVLRREELAALAGLSVDYVVRLEQGRAKNPSPQVLGAIARALRLTTQERDHLFRIAGAAAPAIGMFRGT